MKKALLASILALTSMFGVASAETLVLGAGVAKGGYDQKMQQLNVRLGQQGFDGQVRNFEGSDEITLNACRNEIDVWIAQIDAVVARRKEGCNLVPLRESTREVAILMVPPTKVDEFTKLKHFSDTSRIGVGTAGSGSDLFWYNISSYEKEQGSQDKWAEAQPVYMPSDEFQVAADFDQIDAALLIQDPKSPKIETLLKAGWVPVELWDKNIANIKLGEAPVYEENKYTYYDGKGRAREFWGYTVKSYIGISPAAEKNSALKAAVKASR